MTTVNNQSPIGYGYDSSSGVEGKKTENKQENKEGNLDNQAANTGSNPYQDQDNADINPNNTKESEHPVTVIAFDNETNKSAEARLKDKPEFTKEEQAISDFIAKTKDETFAAIIKSFDQMLINARKMMEENQRYYKEKIAPREEAMKKELVMEDIQKEVIKKAII